MEQGIKDLKTCIEDIESAALHFSRFDVTDMGENNMYKLLDVSDKKVVDAARSDLKKRIKASPEKNFYIVMVFAGHGLQMDGKQTVVINALNLKEGYYHRMNAEHDIRYIAKQFGHTYTLGLFACCREIHRSNRHCGLIGPSEQIAVDYFTKKLRAELIMKTVSEDAKVIEAKKVLDAALKMKSEQILAVDEEKEANFGKYFSQGI